MSETVQNGSQSRMTPHQEVAARLEEEIVTGVRFPRERLVEDELMARFGAKRHVVRRALQELENHGLIARTPNVGAHVKVYTAKQVVEIYELRQLLEATCAKNIPLPVPREELDELIGIQRRHDAAADARTLNEIVSTNLEFHHRLFNLSENEILVDAIRRYAQLSYAIRSVTVTSPALVEQARSEHWEMIRALEHEDGDRLAEIAGAHLTPSRDAYLDRL